LGWEVELDSEDAVSSDQVLPFQVIMKFCMAGVAKKVPVATQKLTLVHDIPVEMLITEVSVESEAAESRDQALPFQVRIRF
jgi:hypothetical protein